VSDAGSRTCCAALLAAFVVALLGCGDEGKPRPEPPPKDGGAAEGPPGPSPAPVEDLTPAFRTSRECGECHREIYEEWSSSFHGLAMEDPLFLEMAAESNKEECIRCHAPVPLREAGFETPVARTSLREDAVSCLSCHQRGGQVAGPFAGLSGACRPVQDPDQTNVMKICFPCHNQHDTGNEWLLGPWSPEASEPRVREARTCLDCHMPEVERPLVPGGPVRKGRRHTWPGGHSMEQLRRAAKIEVETEPLEGGGTRFRVFVTNVGAGHAIPTDARHRSFDTYVKVWDARENLVLDPIQDAHESRAHLAKFQKFYRGAGKRDTQIPPLARVDTLGEGPGYVDLPDVAAGRGEAWLVYRLTPRDALEPESLTLQDVRGENEIYLARVVLRVPFEFGK